MGPEAWTETADGRGRSGRSCWRRGELARGAGEDLQGPWAATMGVAPKDHWTLEVLCRLV